MLFTVAQSGYRGDVTGRKRDIDYLQGEIQELFADLWQVPRFAGLRRGFRPQSDCFRTEDPPAPPVLTALPVEDFIPLNLGGSNRVRPNAPAQGRPDVHGFRCIAALS